MILVGRDRLHVFLKKHAQSKNPLAIWSKLMDETDYKDFNHLRKTFPAADYIHHQYTIFNISGNKYRLVTVINYDAQVIVIKKIWTHAEYGMSKNQELLKRGHL
jgi:mRNA interferase HigB